MRICKSLDPVIDIVVIGFGRKSKAFIDFFLEKNELHGVNIIVVCKDSFVFLNEFVQNIQVCQESYIDIYKYCKERNILLINEKVESLDLNERIIHFSSDRNSLHFDFLVLDFDYTSSYLLEQDFAHNGVYPFRIKNLFFYYSHIMYLSLMKSQKNRTFDRSAYKNWKTLFMDIIRMERFSNFYSYVDKYVDQIFDAYGYLLCTNINTKECTNTEGKTNVNQEKGREYVSEMGKMISCGGKGGGTNENIDSLKEQALNETVNHSHSHKNCFHFLIISDQLEIGRNMYHEVEKRLKEILDDFSLIYVSFASVGVPDFCKESIVVQSIVEVYEKKGERFVKYMNEDGEMHKIYYDECVNITSMVYPSYIYRSRFHECIDNYINKQVQYEYNEYVYFLNQLKKYEESVIVQTVYTNIYRCINKSKYVSIDDINAKRRKNMKIRFCNIESDESFTPPSPKNLFTDIYRTMVDKGRTILDYVQSKEYIQKKVESFNEYQQRRERKKGLNMKGKNQKEKEISFLLEVLFFLCFYILYYLEFFKKKLLKIVDVGITVNPEESSISHSSSKEEKVGNSDCSSKKKTQEMAEYIYEYYKKEYENRLLIKKKTTYQVRNIKSSESDSSEEGQIIVQNNVMTNSSIMDTIHAQKVYNYINQSISKIMNRSTCGGCGSKVPSNVLSNSLKSLEIFQSSNVYLGVDDCDDCCVFVHSKSKKSEESPALVQTVDFFKSFIDDEYLLGQVIAIHCLSDIYSMGGKGICALCILIVKDGIEKKLEQRLQNVLSGCCQKLKEEKCALSGGHTCAGPENYVGLAVTGKIKKKKKLFTSQHSDVHVNFNQYTANCSKQKGKSWDEKTLEEMNASEESEEAKKGKENENKNQQREYMTNFQKHELLQSNYRFLPKGSKTIRSGDVIITTKMFGFGFIMAAHIEKKARARWVYQCIDEMIVSNKKSGLYFLEQGVKACTDVTGFGILGHLNEIIKNSRKEQYLSLQREHDRKEEKSSDTSEMEKEGKNRTSRVYKNSIGAKLFLNNIPVAEGVKYCVENNIFSSMFKKNHFLCNTIINLEEALLYEKYGILFDPQTSGGLLVVVEKEQAPKMVNDLKLMGYKHTAVIGEIINVQFKKWKNVQLNQISLNDYIDTTNSIYVEC